VPERDFDIVVWGASGFTGRLVVEYLAATYGVDGDLRWAIAGRDRGRLDAVVRSSLPGAETANLPVLLADSDDPESLLAMARQTRVVCTTVGPYARYGTPLVAACIETGTHYCDLTGEVQWMARLIPRYQDAAQASGARIVHACGFDSVPFDMGNWYLQQLMFERHGRCASQVKTRVGRTSGGASGGTIASIMNLLDEARKDPSIRRLVADPYALYPAGTPPGRDGRDQTGAVFDPDFQQWTSPFIMAAINTRVVRRSNALLGFPWGEDFRYDEAVLSPSRSRAVLASVAGGIGLATLAFGPTRKLAQRFLPNEIYLRGIDHEDRGRDTVVTVSGDLDPGYGSTSRMLGEAAVCLAQDNLNVGGGFWTTASALGGTYLERLRGNAGLRFEPADSPARSD